MTGDPYSKLAFALDGLIRSRVTGDGGEDFARKNIRLIAEALGEMHANPKAAERAQTDRLRDALESIDRLLSAVPVDQLAPVTKRIVGEARAAATLALRAEDGAA